MNKTRHLSCELTKEELHDKCSQLSTRLAEVELAKSQLASQTKKLKEELDELQGQTAALAREIRNKSEMRDVEITQEKDLEKKVMRTVRLDTNEVIDERALLPVELQHELPLGGAKDVPDDSDDPVTVSFDSVEQLESVTKAIKKKFPKKLDEKPLDGHPSQWWKGEP